MGAYERSCRTRNITRITHAAEIHRHEHEAEGWLPRCMMMSSTYFFWFVKQHSDVNTSCPNPETQMIMYKKRIILAFFKKKSRGRLCTSILSRNNKTLEIF